MDAEKYSTVASMAELKNVRNCQFAMPSPSPEEEQAYLEWQADFVRQRLILGWTIALFIIPSFIILNSLGLDSYLEKMRNVWFKIQTVQEIAIFICVLLMHSRFALKMLPALFLAVSWIVTVTPIYYNLEAGYLQFDVISWTLVFLAQTVLSPVCWRWHLLSQLGTFLFFFTVKALYPNLISVSAMHENSHPLFYLYLFWFCVICGVAVYFYEKLQRNEFFARMKLQAEQEKSERLLLNILPASIAARLKDEQSTIADHFDEVSVLFADIVGFTELSSRMSPTQLVKILNHIFSSFDNLVERHGLEKIKTIGDAYMVVAGLPTPHPEHVKHIANLALEMQQVLAEFNRETATPLNIRIGIHTGAVVAGVIGIKKFAYDLWGDTVNTASRMESHGVEGAIQVTQQVYAVLKHHTAYSFIPRGSLEIKGKGQMPVYLLEGVVS